MDVSPPLTADRSKEEKRERILEAATRVFAEKGFPAARISDIARMASVADGTIYLYFRGKDHLLLSIFQRQMDRFLKQAEAILEQIPEPLARLERILSLHISSLGDNPRLATVFQVELRGDRQALETFSKDRFADYIELLSRVIEQGQLEGVFRSGVRPKTAARIVFGAIDEVVTHWVLAQKPSDLESAGRAALDILLNGLKVGS